jgi:hypothetical protein
MSRILFGVLCSGLLLAGCARPPEVPKPNVHAAAGTLQTRAGLPVTSGTIQFVPADGAARPTTTAQVRPDGTFELVALDIAGNKHPGAEPGIYTVIYLPQMSDDQNVQQVMLPDKQTVKAEDNHFSLKLP